jgi:hypothetical protein
MHAPQDNPSVCNDANSGSAIEAFVYRPAVETRRKVLFSQCFNAVHEDSKNLSETEIYIWSILHENSHNKIPFLDNLVLELPSVSQK